MKIYLTVCTLLFASTLIACGPKDSAESTAGPTPSNKAAEPEGEVSGNSGTAEPDQVNELAGTSWRLVKISSMDDTEFAPADTSKYTLTFSPDGAVSIQADCNRGSGAWISESAGAVTFTPIAATMAMCPPESLSDKYLSQFEWVRSYLIKDGHLHLATMADGAIIEFEPSESPAAAATVLGEDVVTQNAGEMQSIVIGKLFDQYAEEHQLAATDEEIGLFVDNLEKGQQAQESMKQRMEELSAEETELVAAMRQKMAQSMIRQWKINQALFNQYGGRVIFQQFGPEPLDAYRMFLEEKQEDGSFRINNPAMEQDFWHYFTDDSMHTFYQQGSEAEAAAFSTPLWEQLIPGQ